MAEKPKREPPPPPTTQQALGCLTIILLAGLGVYACSQMPTTSPPVSRVERAPAPSATATAAVATPASTAQYLVSSDHSVIAVWISQDALVRGLKIAFAGDGVKHLALIKPLMSCVVNSGTKVIVDDPGTTTSSVVVLGGGAEGCEGQVPNFYIHDTPNWTK